MRKIGSALPVYRHGRVLSHVTTGAASLSKLTSRGESSREEGRRQRGPVRPRAGHILAMAELRAAPARIARSLSASIPELVFPALTPPDPKQPSWSLHDAAWRWLQSGDRRAEQSLAVLKRLPAFYPSDTALIR